MSTKTLIMIPLLTFLALGNIQISDPLFKADAKVDYLIVAPDDPALLNEWRRLARYKQEKGLKTRIATVDSIAKAFEGFDLPDKIRTFLQHAYTEWDVTWVLLAGDLEQIPARRVSTGSRGFLADSMSFFSDIYYSCLDGEWDTDGDSIFGNEESDAVFRLKCRFDEDGNYVCDKVKPEIIGVDLWSDVYLGRLPASTADEARIMVDKTIGYLYSPRTDAKSDDIFLFGPQIHYRLAADTASRNLITDAAQFWHYEFMPILQDGASPFREAEIDELYEDRVTNDGFVVGDSMEITAQALGQHLSNGYNLVFFAAHGAPYEIMIRSEPQKVFGFPEIKNLRSNNFSNVISISCDVMKWIPDSNTCFAKSLLTNPSGGAVTYNGSSGPDYFVFKRRHYVRAAQLMCGSRVRRLSRAFQIANLQRDRYNRFVHQFWGDPELHVWTRNMTESDSLALTVKQYDNTYRVRVSPAVDSALVCCYKEGEVFARAYAHRGVAELDAVNRALEDLTFTATHVDNLPGRLVIDAAEIPVRTRHVQPAVAAARGMMVRTAGRRLRITFADRHAGRQAWITDMSGRTIVRSGRESRMRTWTVEVPSQGVYVLNVRDNGRVHSRTITVRR